MEFTRNPPGLQRVLVDYCQLLSCEDDKSSLRCDSVFNQLDDEREGACARARVGVTIKDIVTTKARFIILARLLLILSLFYGV